MNLTREYIQKHAEAAILHLKQFAVDADEEAMHQFRVNMKKLRAVFRMVHQINPDHKFEKRYKKKFKLLFADGGQIRQLQLITSELKKNKYRALLQQSASLKQLPQLILLFSEKSKRYKNLLASYKKNLSQLASQVKEQELIVYAAALKQTIVKNKISVTADEWHELRKQIKQLLYITNLLQPASRIKVLTVAQVKQYNALQEIIGAWHDLEDYKTWLMSEGFFMSEDVKVKQAFSKAWHQLNRQITNAEKKVQSSLMQMHKKKTAL